MNYGKGLMATSGLTAYNILTPSDFQLQSKVQILSLKPIDSRPHH